MSNSFQKKTTHKSATLTFVRYHIKEFINRCIEALIHYSNKIMHYSCVKGDNTANSYVLSQIGLSPLYIYLLHQLFFKSTQ